MRFVDSMTVKNDLEDAWKETFLTCLKLISWCSIKSALEYHRNPYLVLNLPLPDFEKILNKGVGPYAAINIVLLRIIFWDTQFLYHSFILWKTINNNVITLRNDTIKFVKCKEGKKLFHVAISECY